MKYLPMAAALAVVLFAAAAVGGPVNINSADAATLSDQLKGVGPAKAAAIVEYRQKHGSFHNIDELALVKGIGQKFIDKNRADLRITAVAPGKPGATTASASAATVVPRKR